MGTTKKRTKQSKKNHSKKRGSGYARGCTLAPGYARGCSLAPGYARGGDAKSNKMIVKIYPKSVDDLANLKNGHIIGDYRIDMENNIPESAGSVDYFLSQVGEYITQQTTPIDVKNMEKTLKLKNKKLFSNIKFVYELVPQLYNTVEESKEPKPIKQKEEVVLDLKKTTENKVKIPPVPPPVPPPVVSKEAPVVSKEAPVVSKEAPVAPPKAELSQNVLNAFETLNLNPNATKEEIKNAIKVLALPQHPDKQINKTEDEKKEAAEKWTKYNGAIEVLKDNNIYKGGKKRGSRKSKKQKV